MQALTDNALMLKVKSGHLDTMGLLYERHKKRLFGFFYAMHGNAAVSEDLVQNVFVRMLKYKHSFTGEGSFTAWMFRTAKNVNYDHYKKNKSVRYQNDMSSIAYKLADSDTIEQDIQRKEEVSLLQKAMTLLTPEKREILILSKLKQMKFKEVGAVLDCSEGAAKVKAHRALQDLRTIFSTLEKL